MGINFFEKKVFQKDTKHGKETKACTEFVFTTEKGRTVFQEKRGYHCSAESCEQAAGHPRAAGCPD
ncbi:hypothetical cytosolic protein [Syntrophus aciditrophicus SB]|uniref:Hypothetical cytosolic protein n=1 Tax=Syntrophus aciditrophicus (strain SB) TaxID=56780 RepID=Q2LW78_SYNAS|nr:hypothetical cytosolic protein [Syntrophus aciditrophicus SB]